MCHCVAVWQVETAELEEELKQDGAKLIMEQFLQASGAVAIQQSMVLRWII